MDGLFKLIFYIIIGIVWVLSNTKKQISWKETETPDFPVIKPKLDSLPKPKMDQPSREGIFFEDEQVIPFDQFKQSSYDKKLSAKKKRLQEKKQQISAEILEQNINDDIELDKKIPSSLPAVVENHREKQSYHLKSSLKEGIIWSIVLGAPRSKQAFNWQTGPLNR